MTFGVLIAAIGLGLVVWPKPIVAYVKMSRSGSGLSLNARVREPVPVHRVEVVGRLIGFFLVVSGVTLVLALS